MSSHFLTQAYDYICTGEETLKPRHLYMTAGPRLNIKTVLSTYAISVLKIRQPLGRLIFNMGIAIPGKSIFLIETAPSVLVSLRWYQNSKLLTLCGIKSPATAGFLSQRDSNQEYIFMSWHQHWICFVLSVTFIQHFAIPMVVDVEFVMTHESIRPDIMPLWTIWLAGYMYKQKWTFVINENQYTAKTKLVLIHNNFAS